MAEAYRPISDYAIIGDCRACALVSRRGSIDWLCAPRFDAPSLFNALLDHWRGGRFLVAPAGPFTSVRRYVPGTAVLETEFRGAGGRALLTDFAPALSEADKRGRLLPFWSLVRVVTVLEGRVPLQMLFEPRPRHGAELARLRPLAPGVCGLQAGRGFVTLSCDGPFQLSGSSATGSWELRAGESRTLWLACHDGAPAVLPALKEAPELARQSAAYWTRWSSRCRCQELRRGSVLRSALTLKLLSYAPSGAIMAAATTSLPEAAGGSRNWDYRYCWLRDASLTSRVFFDLGFSAEASAFVEWMTYATASTHPMLKVFYDLFGDHSHEERVLKSLEGYRGSRPARAGNDAQGQYQLDVYGEVLESLKLHVESGAPVDSGMRRLIVELGDYVCGHWSLPDHGVWELRGPARHFVHSKLMCWAALHHAERLGRRLRLQADYARWAGCRRAIRTAILEHGWSQAKGSFVQAFGGDALDASALQLLVSGFLRPDDPRALSTVAAVRSELARGELVYRYRIDDGLPGREGAFLACSFWLVEALTVLGRLDEAVELFERLERRRNDVGLYSEELDPDTGEALGNFPQAFSHMTHIRAALRLDAALSGRSTPAVRPANAR